MFVLDEKNQNMIVKLANKFKSDLYYYEFAIGSEFVRDIIELSDSIRTKSTVIHTKKENQNVKWN